MQHEGSGQEVISMAECEAVAAIPERSGNQSASLARVRVVGLKVDYVDRPLGLQNPHPSFSWRLESAARNVRQSAYRILVASDPAGLEGGQGDLWDSGKVESNGCLSIRYRGKELESRRRYWWTVQVWDELGQAAIPAEPSWWEMGLLSPEAWVAQWIAVDDETAKADRETALQWVWGAGSDGDGVTVRRFRVAFDLPEATRSGVLFAIGRSCFEKVVGVWLDDVPVTATSRDCDATGENLQVGHLSAGRHWLFLEVRRENPWPEHFQELPTAGIALLARFDTDDGRSLRVVSGAEWKTNVPVTVDSHRPREEGGHGTWVDVSISPLQGYVVREPAMHLRRTLSIEKDVSVARLYVSALGCYEARLNGRRVGDALLTPEVSQYEERLLYQTYDVRELISRGPNVLGFTVGDGWYASHPGRYAWGPPPRRLIAQLELTYVDGTRDTIGTGPDWRVARSPILQSELCVGEVYDARLEQRSWDTATFDDSSWPSAVLVPAPPCRLVAQVSPPIRATQVLKPAAITSPHAGVYVFDFGQNFAGWCRLHVKGDRGVRVDLRYAEQIKPGGEIDQFSLNGGKAVDVYVLRGDAGGETFEPHFTYHGFRYVQVTGLPGAPSLDSLEGVVVHTDLERTSRLRVDHPMVQKLWENIVWTQRSNFMAVGTDCCNRDERMGYFNDMSIFWDAATFNMDVAAFTRRQMDNARDHQYETGAFAPLAPAPAQYVVYRSADGTATPGWGDGALILAWTSWRRYGDIGVLEQSWDAMNRHLQFILDRNPNYLWLNGRGPDYGDWLAIGEQHFMRPDIAPTTPFDMFATAYWARSADLLAQVAEVLNRPEDARRLRAVREQVRKAFIEAFVDASGKVGNGSQTSCLLALKFDLVGAEVRPHVLRHLVEDIGNRGFALSTGIIGTQYLLDVLADAGFAELACTLLLRREYPSWGYMLDHGATTIWERWDGSLERNYLTASHNHFSLGSVGAFLFCRLAGIEEAEPGFQKIRVRPLLDARIRRGGGDYESIMGRISTDWERSAQGDWAMIIELPANTSGLVHLPARRDSRVDVDGRDISACQDIRVLHRLEQEMIVEVGSGRYRFMVKHESPRVGL
jgi:alpha-L-rhamnosidase